VNDSQKVYEIRCPVHGFILLNEWERTIIEQAPFQRLRRIKQLGWTDYVYPGAVHTRFEHSLGVMYVAALLYESIVRQSEDVLISEFSYNENGLERHKQLVRLAALLHDLGHGPFSHAAEDLLPVRDGTAERYRHEEYSAAIIRSELKNVIEDHPYNRARYGFTVDDITALIHGESKGEHALFWRDVVRGQLDADRMDYLLRDSLHAGVSYGKFDLHRLIGTIVAVPGNEGIGLRLGITEGGWHAAESLVIARYLMFTQVYFHKTRVAYDIHLHGAMKEILPQGIFPKPDPVGIKEFLKWDDWRVLGLLSNGAGGEHGQRLRDRNHFRNIYHTKDTPSLEEIKQLDIIRKDLGALVAAEGSGAASWYKAGKLDIPVLSDVTDRITEPLSKRSKVVAAMTPNNQILLYARREDVPQAMERLKNLFGGEE
jgi:HD superfamily phosphohydrolase